MIWVWVGGQFFCFRGRKIKKRKKGSVEPLTARNTKHQADLGAGVPNCFVQKFRRRGRYDTFISALEVENKIYNSEIETKLQAPSAEMKGKAPPTKLLL
jgi:hypothetical protein